MTTVTKHYPLLDRSETRVGGGPRWLIPFGLVALGQSAVLFGPHVPVLSALVGLGVLIAVPVLVLCRRVAWSVESWWHAGVFSLGLTVLGVMIAALVVNTVLPWFGIDRPLSLPFLVAVSMAADLALLSWRRSVPLVEPGTWSRVLSAGSNVRFEPAVSLGVTAVVLAILGAVRLNNGLGGGVAVASHAAVVGSLVVAMFRRGSLSRDAVVVLTSAAALLLTTSLRGWFITGHDIQREYVEFLLTHGADRWELNSFQAAYNACLSVNVLPHVVAEFTGLSGVVVFKVVLQLFAAVVALTVLLISRQLVSPRLAMMGTALFLVFPTFQTDLPYLVRQEVAFVFLGLTFLAALQTSWPQRFQRVIAAAFGLGVVISHYSTTYLLLFTVLVAAAAVGIAEWRRRITAVGGRIRRQPLVLLHPLIVVVLLAGTWLWTNPATQSGGHFSQTVVSMVDGLIHGTSVPGSSDTSYGLFSGTRLSADERFDAYVASVEVERRTSGTDDLVLTDPTSDERRPQLLERETAPLTGLGSAISSLGVDVEASNAVLRLAVAGLLQLFLIIGIVVVMLRLPLAAGYGREATWLTIGSLGALAAVTLVPGLSAEYGVLRAFQQAMVLGAPAMAIGVVACLGFLRSRAAAAAMVVTAAVAFVLSGVQPALVGGYQTTLSQGNDGLYFDLYHVSDREMSAMRWLAGVDADSEVQAEVISDKVTAGRLQSVLERGVLDDFFPTELRRDSYVYLSTSNLLKRRATIFYTGDLLTYRYPVETLDRELDLVYSNAGARIYR